MRKQSGFTLVEALFTLMIAGVLVGVAAPSFKTSVQNSRLVTQANDLLGMLLYARSEAVNGGQNAIICASSDHLTCSGSNWASGWVVCSPTCSSANNPLRVEPALSGSNTLTTSPSVTTITFNATGAPTTGAQYFDLCDSRGATYGRAIYVYAQGMTRISTTVGKKMDGTTTMSCT